MSALISTKLLPRSYEAIRDQIAAIILVEMENQRLLYRDDNLSVSVFCERFGSYDPAEGNVINVVLASGVFDNHSIFTQRDELVYYIDVFTSSSGSILAQGDNRVSVLNHRIVGMVNAIFNDQAYVRLGLANGIIESRRTTNISFSPYPEDNDFVKIGRLTLTVTAHEDFRDGSGTMEAYLNTVVKLSETDKGFKFEIIN